MIGLLILGAAVLMLAGLALLVGVLVDTRVRVAAREARPTGVPAHKHVGILEHERQLHALLDETRAIRKSLDKPRPQHYRAPHIPMGDQS